MVFVHARTATVKTAMTLREMASNQNDCAEFEPDKNAQYAIMEKKVNRFIFAFNLLIKRSKC